VLFRSVAFIGDKSISKNITAVSAINVALRVVANTIRFGVAIGAVMVSSVYSGALWIKSIVSGAAVKEKESASGKVWTKDRREL